MNDIISYLNRDPQPRFYIYNDLIDNNDAMFCLFCFFVFLFGDWTNVSVYKLSRKLRIIRAFICYVFAVCSRCKSVCSCKTFCYLFYILCQVLPLPQAKWAVVYQRGWTMSLLRPCFCLLSFRLSQMIVSIKVMWNLIVLIVIIWNLTSDRLQNKTISHGFKRHEY